MKIALITGGSRGLGRSAALSLAQQGVGVILTYQHNADAAHSAVHEITQAGGQAVAMALDTTRTQDFEAFEKAFQAQLQHQWQRTDFDILINNAGFGLHKALADTSEAEFDALMQVHLKGPFFLTQRLVPLMADGGRILNISSGLTRFSFPGSGAYAAMKGAVEVWTRYLAVELGARKIRVNTLAPGAIATDFRDGAVRDTPQVREQIGAHTALGRVGEAEDIGPLMAALVTDSHGWVNGQRIEASGGMLL